jgi:hypothetical protein
VIGTPTVPIKGLTRHAQEEEEEEDMVGFLVVVLVCVGSDYHERKPEEQKVDGNAVAFPGRRYVLIYRVRKIPSRGLH